ncbi:unnamed protein product [Miscanthus lutarioriparius]|uniref:HMA domain-containing protein n=1 Tax=Miscanthus lutarioriparius TaxID=422564 RepID=A0A811NST8_9POAL|nr:unnamed protein product [Miscanthus lutarioriparius]
MSTPTDTCDALSDITNIAGTNYFEMGQITPIILDKENIPPDAHRNDIHVGIGTATTDTWTTGQEKAQDIKAPGKGAGDVPATAAEEELVIRAPVHCDGCGRKLRRSLQRLEGVGEVTVDSRTNTVVVRGRRVVENASDVVEVVERRTGEKAVLVSPSPEKLPPPRSAAKGGETKDKKDDANTKDDTGDDELPEVNMEMVTVLKMNLHCDACSEEIRRRILKITGVEEAVPHLKSSQVMVKGKVEPATLVGFIYKCTGRKAAIIRAEPLDDLLQSAKSTAPPTVVAPVPPVEAENPPGEKKNGGQNGKKEEPNEENKGGGGQEEDHVDDESPETEKPSDGGHGAEEHGTHPGEAQNHDGGGHGDGLVLENHTKDDHLFTVPMPAGVVTVAPEMALSNRSYFYPSYPSYAQYYYPYQQYQYPQAYPAYACSPAAMYGYGYPANYPPEAFSEENPNACTIV